MSRDRLARKISAEIEQRLGNAVAADPAVAMRTHFGLTLQPSSTLGDQRGAGGACDGISFLRHGVVMYAPTKYSRRENFTLVHELAHHLVENDDDALDWIADRDDPDRDLESLCDRIAQYLLLSEQLVNSVLAGQTPRAEHVNALYDASMASEPVCAIALAARLPVQGAVIIADLGGDTVIYASVQADANDRWPKVFPWPGNSLPSDHPIKRMDTNARFTRKSWWRTPWGETQEYYVDAVSGQRRVHAVFAVIDLWGAERVHLDAPPVSDDRPTKEIRCCGQTRHVRAWPCPTCREPHCPNCGRCGCDRAIDRQVLCTECFLYQPAKLVVDGRCPQCRGVD
jgi:hypothetical protein